MDALNPTAGIAAGEAALDALTMRHQAIAANIANVHSEGYRPLRVNFEEQMASIDFSAADAAQKVKDVKPFIQEEPPSDIDPGVALDMEVVRLNQNTLRFQALITALNKSLSMTNLAVRDGRE